ncbi:MAG: TetR/AcrR family transcriptional regulator C-terminal domain-containing protein [Spirillospora sp.]
MRTISSNKDDVLDGGVEVLWEEVENAAPAQDDWLAGARAFAHALRDVMRRHPNAAPLIMSRSIMPIPALRIVQEHIKAAIDGGTREDRAYALLRALTSYALGSAQAEVTWGITSTGCAPKVGDLLRPGTPDDLAAVAEVFCGQSDLDAQFDLGLDLMLRGIDCRPAR